MTVSFPFFHARANGRSLWTSDAAAIEAFSAANPGTEVRTFDFEDELSTHMHDLSMALEEGRVTLDAETRRFNDEYGAVPGV